MFRFIPGRNIFISIVSTDLGASSHKGFFSDSTLQFEVSLKNGFKDGPFTEYYQDGEVKMKGYLGMINVKEHGASLMKMESLY